MNTASKLGVYPDVDRFSISLGELDLISRCRAMQQLQSAAFPFKKGYRLSYACMDGVLSPLTVIAGQIKRGDVTPYSLACGMLSDTASKLSSYPVDLSYFDLPLGFISTEVGVRYAGGLRTKGDNAQSAHELAAYIILNEKSYVEIGLGIKSCVNVTVVKRDVGGVVVTTGFGGTHEKTSSLKLSVMLDYMMLFNVIVMALNEA
tara:strand:+ start:581 stop:1192 length:612 start_codon:yes stop_codon:yes gene_type:complete